MPISFNGAGTFNINSSGQPVITGTTISSTAFNALTADLGTGLSTAICKDGQSACSARIPFIFGIDSSLTTNATSISTGSIITEGGIGCAKALWVGDLANIAKAVTVQDMTNATSVSTGSVITSGGIGAAKALWVGGLANIAGALTVTGHVTLEGVTSTGATGTGKLVFDTNPTLNGKLGINNAATATLDVLESGTANTYVDAVHTIAIVGPSVGPTGGSGQVFIQSNDALAADVGGVLAFGGRYVTASANSAFWAGIAGRKENVTSTDLSGYLQFITRGASAAERVRITSKGSVVLAVQGALATNATDGFTYVPTCAGTPTGAPTAFTGAAAMVYDTTNNKLYVYNSAWKGVTLA